MLPQKRKKNLKIDNTEKLDVYDIQDIDSLLLEEFTLPPIDSGMEAEEEKEVHLKEVIEHKSSDIPVPVIETSADYVVKHNIIPIQYCRYQKDVDLEYEKTEEDFEVINNLGIDPDLYFSIVEKIKRDVDSNDRVCMERKYPDNEIYDTVLNALKYKFLLRNECEKAPSYVCFRQRLLKPSKKNRRSEFQAREKITRLNSELTMLIKMCDLYKENNIIDKDIAKLNLKIIKITNELSAKDSRTRKKLKKILNCKEHVRNSQRVLYKDLLNNVLYNRDNIRLLKRKINARIAISDEELKKEYLAYRKYVKDKNENIDS